MANHLFEAGDLSSAANKGAARKLGLDVDEFQACTRAPETDARIDRESKILRDSGFQGLPTTFIGHSKIVGVRDDDVFREALASAAQGEEPSGLPWWVFWPGAALLAVGIGYGAQLRAGGKRRSGV
jgi:hypothetical protein